MLMNALQQIKRSIKTKEHLPVNGLEDHDADAEAWPEIGLAHETGRLVWGVVVASPEEVDAVIAQAEAGGAMIPRRGAATFWGGYSGVFIDPDGHPLGRWCTTRWGGRWQWEGRDHRAWAPASARIASRGRWAKKTTGAVDFPANLGGRVLG